MTWISLNFNRCFIDFFSCGGSFALGSSHSTFLGGFFLQRLLLWLLRLVNCQWNCVLIPENINLYSWPYIVEIFVYLAGLIACIVAANPSSDLGKVPFQPRRFALPSVIRNYIHTFGKTWWFRWCSLLQLILFRPGLFWSSNTKNIKATSTKLTG